MWYHWLLVLAGLYLVGSAIFSIISNRSMQNIIMSTVQIVIGGAIGYYGYSNAMAPVTPSIVPPAVTSTVNTMMGGMRRMFRKH